MTPLTQQLEDKKKELKLLEKRMHKYFLLNRTDAYTKILLKVVRLEGEIAILEQAIAEMQKQRQDIFDLIKFNCIYRQRGLSIDIEEAENTFDAMGKEYFRGMKQGYNDLQRKLEDIKYLIDAVNIKYLSAEETKEFEKLKQQLNQPKTE